LAASGVLADLYQDAATFGKPAVIAHEQKSILFQTNIHKGSLQSRYHILNPAQENITDQVILTVTFYQIFP
jgi:hypothetical protein